MIKFKLMIIEIVAGEIKAPALIIIG
jgi:hypothetical protein